MRIFFKRILRQETVIAIIVIFLITVITHGLRINELGYYFDDWYVLWSASSRGAASLVGLFSTDRPAMGFLYFIVYRVIGDSIIGWHLYALAWRFIGALSFFWIISSFWPKHKFLTTAAAVLFVVYPGFLSEPDALTKVNHLTGFGSALLSMAFMVGSLHTQRKALKIPFEILAILAGSAYVWIYEYMIGLEALRLALLGLFYYRNGIKSFFSIIKAILLKYWPYILTISAFLFWRFFVFNSSRPTTNVEGLLGAYGTDPLNMGIRIISQTILDFLSVTVFAWFVKLYNLLAQAEYARIAVAVAFTCVGILLVFLYRLFLSRSDEPGKDSDSNPHSALEMTGVGLVGTVCAILPVVVSNRSIDLLDAYKSYGLHPSAGVILLVMGLLVLFQPKARFAAVLALLFLSMTAHSLNIDYWKTYWQMERSMWWQVTWRAPDIADNTLVMAYPPRGYLYMQDYEIWGPLNLIYRSGKYDAPSIQSQVLNEVTIVDVLSRTKTYTYIRDVLLNLDYGNLLLVSQPTLDSCVHIIDGKMPAYSSSERSIIKEAGIYSNTSYIQMDGSYHIPLAAIFGGEPAHDWCYFYQKASLARQAGNWQAVLDLYDKTQEMGLQPNDRSEYFPFIEALVNTGNLDKAKLLDQEVSQKDKALRYSFCISLLNGPDYPPSFQYNYDDLRALFCNN